MTSLFRKPYLTLLLPMIVSGAISSSCAAQEVQTVKAQIWVDNWFAMYVNGNLVKEDSESINREQSFNAEVFSFQTTLPAVVAVKLMDYKADDSGLEYIGSNRQQMGDGGFIGEFRNASNELIGVTSSDWVCKVIHQAPLNKACERSANPIQECQSNILPEPANWTAADFDDSSWTNAVVHSSRDVRPHGGYSQYSWDASSSFIWGEDLEVDNTILCRVTLK